MGSFDQGMETLLLYHFVWCILQKWYKNLACANFQAKHGHTMHKLSRLGAYQYVCSQKIVLNRPQFLSHGIIKTMCRLTVLFWWTYGPKLDMPLMTKLYFYYMIHNSRFVQTKNQALDVFGQFSYFFSCF